MNWGNSTVLSIYFNVWHIIIITESCFIIIGITPLIYIIVLIWARIYLITMLFVFAHIHFKFTLFAHAINTWLWRNLLYLLATCTLSHVAISCVWWFQIFFFHFLNNIRHFIMFIVWFCSNHFKQGSTVVFKLIVTWFKLCHAHLRSLEMLSHI